MKSHFAFLILTASLFGQAAIADSTSPTPSCLAGSEKELSIEKQVLGGPPTKATDFIQYAKAEMNGSGEKRSCSLIQAAYSDPAQACAQGLQVVNQINPQKQINRDCIRSAIKRIPNLKVDHFSCRSDTDARPLSLMNPPCLTENYLNYVHFTVNQAMKCLGQVDDPVDPQIIFQLMNDESSFSATNHTLYGVGLAHLTTDGGTTMSPGNPGYDFMLGLMRKNSGAIVPECKAFENVVRLPLQLDLDGNARTCQYVGIGNGMARSAIEGIGLYLYYRSGMQDSAEEILRNQGIDKRKDLDFKKIRDRVAQVAFSQVGPAGGQEYARKIASYLKTYNKKEGRYWNADEAFAVKNRLGLYLRQINKTMDDSLGKDGNHNCVEGNPL
jgi:hypothetical protein